MFQDSVIVLLRVYLTDFCVTCIKVAKTYRDHIPLFFHPSVTELVQTAAQKLLVQNFIQTLLENTGFSLWNLGYKQTYHYSFTVHNKILTVKVCFYARICWGKPKHSHFRSNRFTIFLGLRTFPKGRQRIVWLRTLMQLVGRQWKFMPAARCLQNRGWEGGEVYVL